MYITLERVQLSQLWLIAFLRGWAAIAIADCRLSLEDFLHFLYFDDNQTLDECLLAECAVVWGVNCVDGVADDRFFIGSCWDVSDGDEAHQHSLQCNTFYESSFSPTFINFHRLRNESQPTKNTSFILNWDYLLAATALLYCYLSTDCLSIESDDFYMN